MSESSEKKVIIFTVRLVLMDQAGDGLRQLGFIWATVVVLGGFVTSLKPIDFWFSSLLLLIEGPRIFSVVRDLISESEMSNGGAIRNDFKPEVNIRKLSERTPCELLFEVLRICYGTRISNTVNKLLSLLKLLWAVASVLLSGYRLYQHDYGEVPDDASKDRNSALIIFYALSLAYPIIYLLQNAYRCWMIKVRSLLLKLTRESGFDPRDPSDVLIIRRYFDEIYSRSRRKSILDGLKLDLASYSVELLQSSNAKERLWGARFLSNFAKTERCRAIEITKSTIKVMQQVVEITESTIISMQQVVAKTECKNRCQTECQNRCQTECENRCQTESKNLPNCQTKCENQTNCHSPGSENHHQREYHPHCQHDICIIRCEQNGVPHHQHDVCTIS